jgi:hypothetical protein
MEPEHIDGVATGVPARPSRRAVVRAGARLAYAAPLIGASLALSAEDAAAACEADPRGAPDPSPTDRHADGPGDRPGAVSPRSATAGSWSSMLYATAASAVSR